MYVFQKLFTKFWKIAPIEDKLYNDLLNDYDTLLIDITKEWDNFVDEKNERNYAEFKQKLTSSFEAIWKMVAMTNFRNDLREFYMEKELTEHFKFDLNQAKEEVIEICSELNEMIPLEKNNDPLYHEFTNLIKEGNKLTKEEQNKLIKEFHAKIKKKS